MKIALILVENFAIDYESLDQRPAQSLTWNGMPILGFIPKVPTPFGLEQSHPLREGVNEQSSLNGSHPQSLRSISLRAYEKSEEKNTKNAPTYSNLQPYSTFEHHIRVAAHDVPFTTPHVTRPIVRMSNPRKDPSPRFPKQSS